MSADVRRVLTFDRGAVIHDVSVDGVRSRGMMEHGSGNCFAIGIKLQTTGERHCSQSFLFHATHPLSLSRFGGDGHKRRVFLCAVTGTKATIFNTSSPKQPPRSPLATYCRNVQFFTWRRRASEDITTLIKELKALPMEPAKSPW